MLVSRKTKLLLFFCDYFLQVCLSPLRKSPSGGNNNLQSHNSTLSDTKKHLNAFIKNKNQPLQQQQQQQQQQQLQQQPQMQRITPLFPGLNHSGSTPALGSLAQFNLSMTSPPPKSAALNRQRSQQTRKNSTSASATSADVTARLFDVGDRMTDSLESK